MLLIPNEAVQTFNFFGIGKLYRDFLPIATPMANPTDQSLTTALSMDWKTVGTLRPTIPTTTPNIHTKEAIPHWIGQGIDYS